MVSGIKDLSKAYAKKYGCTNLEAEAAVKKVMAVFVDAIADGGVSVMGQFSIELAHRAERTGRNPATGETHTIPASVGLKIKCGKYLKTRLNPTCNGDACDL